MKNDATSAQQLDETSDEQVVEFLRKNPNFFQQHDDLLAELRLPHESGGAISLLERQVTILRDRGIDARQKLSSLLTNARTNDQLFDTTRNLILALLNSENVAETLTVAQEQLSQQENVDCCEIVLVTNSSNALPASVRTASAEELTKKFKDVFRLQRTHCGALEKDKISYLFPGPGNQVKSTALCPISSNGTILAMLALGNNDEDYFNLNLDTLFLDFIGEVIASILKRQITM